jgi:hypothetical protein
MDEQRTTVFIHTRPARGRGVIPTAPPLPRGRLRLGRWVPWVLFVIAILATLNAGLGMAFWWFVLIPVLVCGWHWGFGKNNHDRG